MNEKNNDELIIKVVLVGSSSVGKTSIVSRVMKNEFTDQPPTIGVSFVTHFVYLNNHNQVRLQLWDTAGDERFRAVTPMYFKDCNVAVVVYALNDKKSFNEVKSWVSSVLTHTEVEPLLYIVGNKTDLENSITNEDENELRNDLPGATFYKVSAKTGDGIFDLFELIAENAVSTKHTKNNEQNLIHIHNAEEAREENSCC